MSKESPLRQTGMKLEIRREIEEIHTSMNVASVSNISIERTQFLSDVHHKKYIPQEIYHKKMTYARSLLVVLNVIV